MTILARTERLIGGFATRAVAKPSNKTTKNRVTGSYTAVHPIVRWTFYFFVFSLPFEWPDRPFPVEVPTLTAAFFILITFIQPKVCYRKPPKEMWLFAVFLLIYALRCINIKHTEEAYKQLQLLVQIFLLMWSGYNLMRYEKITKTALIAFLSGCSIIGLMQVTRFQGTEVFDFYTGPRLSVLGQNPNNLANILTLGLIVLLGLLYGRNKTLGLSRSILLPLVALLGVSIFYTGSRGAILSWGVGMMGFVIRGKTIASKVKSLIVVAILLGGLLAVIQADPVMSSRFRKAIYGNKMAGREQLTPAAKKMISQKPWFGWGPGDCMYDLGKKVPYQKSADVFKTAAKHKGDHDPHNTYLYVGMAVGYVGGVPLGAYAILCLIAAIRARKGPQGALPLALILTIATMDYSGTWLDSKLNWLFMGAYALASAYPIEALKPLRALAKQKVSQRVMPAVNGLRNLRNGHPVRSADMPPADQPVVNLR